MKKWVADEFDAMKEADQILSHEIFAFQIQTYQQIDFKWNPTGNRDKTLKFVVKFLIWHEEMLHILKIHKKMILLKRSICKIKLILIIYGLRKSVHEKNIYNSQFH